MALRSYDRRYTRLHACKLGDFFSLAMSFLIVMSSRSRSDMLVVYSAYLPTERISRSSAYKARQANMPVLTDRGRGHAFTTADFDPTFERSAPCK